MGSLNGDPRPNRVTPAVLADQMDSKPVVTTGAFIMQQDGRSFRIDDQCIHFSIIIIIAECDGSADDLLREYRSGLDGHIVKRSISAIMKQLHGLGVSRGRMDFVDRILDMSIRE